MEEGGRSEGGKGGTAKKGEVVKLVRDRNLNVFRGHKVWHKDEDEREG